MVNRITGEPSMQLHERHDASDFETKTQDKVGEGRLGPAAAGVDAVVHSADTPDTTATSRCDVIALRRVRLEQVRQHRLA